MFSLMNLLILRPLPFAEREQLVRIYRTTPYRHRGAIALAPAQRWPRGGVHDRCRAGKEAARTGTRRAPARSASRARHGAGAASPCLRHSSRSTSSSISRAVFAPSP
jgi:hypothetical protein